MKPANPCPFSGGKQEVGEPFNPHVDSCGLYVSEIVQRLPSYILSQGQKLVYRQLVKSAGRRGYCWPSYDYLAKEVGRGLRQTKSDVGILEKSGLIRHTRRGKQQTNSYHFLWSEIFEGEPKVKCKTGNSEVQETVNSEVQSEPVYQRKHSGTSDKREPDTLTDTSIESNSPTPVDDIRLCPCPTQPPHPSYGGRMHRPNDTHKPCSKEAAVYWSRMMALKLKSQS